jgi:hypothetical protein
LTLEARVAVADDVECDEILAEVLAGFPALGFAFGELIGVAPVVKEPRVWVVVPVDRGGTEPPRAAPACARINPLHSTKLRASNSNGFIIGSSPFQSLAFDRIEPRLQDSPGSEAVEPDSALRVSDGLTYVRSCI